jgi:hypothetical protein
MESFILMEIEGYDDHMPYIEPRFLRKLLDIPVAAQKPADLKQKSGFVHDTQQTIQISNS